MTLQDSKQRQQATNPANSYIVQAPAGSGKTELLIQRYLALLAVVEAPEQIIAITFTRKAAAEMQNRIMVALENARQQKLAETEHEKYTLELAQAALDQDRKYHWNLFESPARFRIQTIDALCSSLVRQMPLLATTGSHPEITDDPMQLYEQAAVNTIQHVYTDDQWSTALTEILLWLDNDVSRLGRMISEMLAKREQWLSFVTQKHDRGEIEQTLQDIIQQHLKKILTLIPDGLRTRLSELIQFAASNLHEQDIEHPLTQCLNIQGLPGDSFQDLRYWLGIQKLLLTTDGGWRKRVNKNDGFPAPSSNKLKQDELKQQKENMQILLQDLGTEETLLNALYGLRTLPAAEYDDHQWSMVENFHQVLHLSVAELALVFQERNCIDFTEITQSAIGALTDDGIPTDLALYLDYQIDHILVDEFQDISANQYRLLQGLIAGWSIDDNKSLFLVGDPMQSIYRFREAEVGLYIQTWHEKQLGQISLECLKLSSNFRSSPTIVDWVNQQFNNILPAKDDISVNAVAFSNSVATKPVVSNSMVDFQPSLNRNDIAEADSILECIQDLLSQNSEESIAVLVRSRNHLRQLLPLLNNNNILFHAAEIANLQNVSIVQDLMALTRSYLFLDDRIAWLSVLRAPWCGLKLASLDKIINGDKQLLVWDAIQNSDVVANLEKDEQKRLLWVQEAFADALQNKHRTGLRRAIEGLWVRLCGNYLLNNKEQLIDAESFFEILGEIEQGSELKNLDELNDRVSHLYTGYGNPQTAQVQIMTMHKAKGLEFDHVLLPGLGKRSAISKNELMLWSMLGDLSEQKLVLAPIQATGEDKNPIYNYLKEHDRQKQYYEDARLLYVATTRAKKSLYLFGHVQDKRDHEKSVENFTVEQKSLLAFLWPKLQQDNTSKLQNQTASDIEQSNITYIDQTIRRRVTSWEPKTPDIYFQQQTEVDIEADNELLIEYDWAGENIKRIGTAVHRFIQSMAESSVPWRQIDFSSQRETVSAYLYQLGLTGNIERATDQVVEALTVMQHDKKAQWIFEPNHKHIENEFSLTGYLQGSIKRIKIDRTFIDQNNIRWIVDYKSSRHDKDDVEAFLDQEKLRYQSQLENYAEIMKHYDRERQIKEIRLGLYFPLLQGWREWQYTE